MNVDELRRAFLKFFEERGHRRIPSSSLVPHGDPTLLFTNAGMVQFKPYFMGLDEPPARRLTSIQRCFRTVDIENIGDDSHLTMFEMLGNFSVGDYFKAEAVAWAWEFLTGVLAIPAERLWATVYTDDDEAFELWAQRGVPRERILRYTAAQGNWWGPPGDSGPCGPCSEMHYDWGETAGCASCAGGTCHPDVECGRFLEIWNLVFMTFYQDEAGARTPLPAANIDTGAGLERLDSVLVGARSVYETDELAAVVRRAVEVTGHPYEPRERPEVARGLRSIAEHSRALATLITDGVLPSNEGRGYVLRRVLRRAVYFGHRLGMREPFLDRTVDAAIDASLGANPELGAQREFVRRVVAVEEGRFLATLSRGLDLLDDVLAREAGARVVPGRDMFVLYDTHGLPPELTREVAASHGYGVDEAGFEREMAAQRERSRGEDVFGGGDDDRALRYAALGLESAFEGHERLTAQSAVSYVAAPGGEARERLAEGDEGEIVLDATAFYPEGGGQIGDHGEIVTPGGRFEVTDTQRLGEAIVHAGRVREGAIALGEPAEARVDPTWRSGSARNHTGTHLLHAALRQVLGTHVRQAGSYVGPDRLRFDYTHPEAPSADQMRRIQRLVNQKVREDIARDTMVMGYEEAIERGAIAFFEDRYTSEVRVVEYCEARGRGHEHTAECFSRELCGGTHLHSTGEVGLLRVVSDSSIGAGLRRIEAVTGPEAERFVDERLDVLTAVAQRLRVPALQVAERLDALEEQLAAERRRADDAERRLSAGAADDLAEAAERVGGAALLVSVVRADSVEALRSMVDRLRSHLGSAFITLAAELDGRPMLVAAATDDLVARGVRADEIVRAAARVTGGSGGGRPQMAQAGGRDASRLEEALDIARTMARERLAGA